MEELDKAIAQRDIALVQLNEEGMENAKLKARIKELEYRDANCKTMTEAEKKALHRGWTELCKVLGVSADTHNMPKLIDMVADLVNAQI